MKALVTGAGQRVGRALALALGARGATVAVHYNESSKGAEEVVAQLNASGTARAQAFKADLSDAHAAGALVDAVAEAFGGLDVLINSAGIMHRVAVADVTPALWDQTFNVNLRSQFFTSQAAARHMSKGGVIVNMADLAAFEAWTGYVPHCVSKAGVVSLTRALAHALGPTIRVNAIAPGAVLLPENMDRAMADRLIQTTPLKRLGSPDDVVRAMLYLIDADYVSGETLIVDGGRHVRA